MINKYFSLMTTHAVLLLIGLAEAIRELIEIITSANVGFDTLLINFSNKVDIYSVIVIAINVLTIIALVFSLIYLYKDYKKSAHISYKVFLCLYILIWILETISSFVFVDVVLVNKVLLIIGLIILLILTFGKNLGEKNSKILGIALILVNALIALIILYGFFKDGYSMLPIIVNAFSGYILYILLSSTTYVMVVGKYIDKTSRGAE